MARPIGSVESIFWRHVTPVDEGCWLWRGARTGTGYGHTRVGGRHGHDVTSNRLSWEVHFGPIPDGLFVLHHCDIKLCVRPDHLYLGSQTDNVLDAAERGLLPHARLTTEDVLTIRLARAEGVPGKVLAERYGVHPRTIYDAERRRTWRRVA